MTLLVLSDTFSPSVSNVKYYRFKECLAAHHGGRGRGGCLRQMLFTLSEGKDVQKGLKNKTKKETKSSRDVSF